MIIRTLSRSFNAGTRYSGEAIALKHPHFTRCTSTKTGSANNTFTERSHNCGQIEPADIGKHVNLIGWVKYTRFDNKIIALRDKYGVVQCIVASELWDEKFRRKRIPNESVVRVSGMVKKRPVHQIPSDKTSSSQVEVLVSQFELVNPARKDLPILSRDENNDYTLDNRLRYRYLDLRSEDMQEALKLRAKIIQIFRLRLIDLDFVECETPTLFKRTPGGANEFIVPTQVKDKFYTLTQSPQQMKQLLMIGGVDRYFQVCRCYRDESGRSDRQPEFTQLDIELSFTNQDLVMRLIDDLVYNLLHCLSNERIIQLDRASIFSSQCSIPKISYAQAMASYGTDKPDTRFEWPIKEQDDGRLCIELPYVIDSSTLEHILDLIKLERNIDTSSFTLTSTRIDEGSTVSISSNSEDARSLMGFVRIYIAKHLHQLGRPVYNRTHAFLWVTHFPLFTRNNDTGKLESTHHPFTSPSPETIDQIMTHPEEVVGLHYDLVLNGQEIGGGSIRIHDADLQETVLKRIIGIDQGSFDYFIEALRSGAPPHGGFAFGLDRLIAILLGRQSIRDVCAFPKTSTGRDLMSGSPHEIDISTKRIYHL